MNSQEILNTIRDHASEVYRNTIPEATQNNIEEIQQAMTDGSNYAVANEFMDTLLNMIAKVEIINKNYNNPLKGLKRGKKVLGDTVQEIYTNFLKAKQFDNEGKELLNRNLADTKTIYHRMNRKDKYKVTVGEEELAKAFSSYDNLSAYISDIISKLTSSAELDEFTLMKQLIKQALDNNAIKVVNVADPCKGEVNGKEFIKTVKTVSGDMTFANSNNNAYLEAQTEDKNPLITFSKKSEQVLILDNATDVSLSVDVLASIFNMSVAEFNDTRKIVIDAFPDKDIRGCLVDERFFQVFDDGTFFRSFENPEGLYRNYILHVRQTLAYSILVNAVVFKVVEDKNADSTVSTYTVTKTLKDGVTLSNRRVNLAEGSAYSTSIKGLDGSETITVTMGGSDITTDVLEEDFIDIESVTGDIVITVA